MDYEEKFIANYILVPLNPHDQIEEIIPRIEEVAQAGMTVIFLIPYQAGGFFKNRRIRAELSTKGMLMDRKALIQYSYKKQTRLADEKVSVAREALRARGIKVIVYVYVDRLRSVLESYRRNGGGHRVLLPRGNAIPIIGFLRQIVAFSSSFKGSSPLPYSYYCREI
jgi:hypothetical protein